VETNAAATAATLKPAGLPGAQPSSRTVCNESLQAPTLLYFALYFFMLLTTVLITLIFLSSSL